MSEQPSGPAPTGPGPTLRTTSGTSARQTVVTLLGLGLVWLVYWTGAQRKALTGTLFGGSNPLSHVSPGQIIPQAPVGVYNDPKRIPDASQLPKGAAGWTWDSAAHRWVPTKPGQTIAPPHGVTQGSYVPSVPSGVGPVISV